MQRTKKHRIVLSVIPACGLGVAFALICMLLLTLSSALFIDNEYFDIDSVRYFIPVIQFISVLFGSVLGGKIVGDKCVLACLVSGGAYCLLQICCAMLLFDGISGGIWIGLVAAAAAIICAIIICNRGKKRSGSKKKRKPNR